MRSVGGAQNGVFLSRWVSYLLANAQRSSAARNCSDCSQWVWQRSAGPPWRPRLPSSSPRSAFTTSPSASARPSAEPGAGTPRADVPIWSRQNAGGCRRALGVLATQTRTAAFRQLVRQAPPRSRGCLHFRRRLAAARPWPASVTSAWTSWSRSPVVHRPAGSPGLWQAARSGTGVVLPPGFQRESVPATRAMVTPVAAAASRVGTTPRRSGSSRMSAAASTRYCQGWVSARVSEMAEPRMAPIAAGRRRRGRRGPGGRRGSGRSADRRPGRTRRTG